MKKRNKFYFLIGVILVVLALASTSIFASPIDNVNITFEKNVYSVTENSTLKVNFVIKNNNQAPIDLLVYSGCNSDELRCDYSKKLTVPSLATITTSLVVVPVDSGSSNLYLYARDIQTNQEQYFSTIINSDDSSTDGDFDITLSSSTFCKNDSYSGYIYVNDVQTPDMYNVSLTSDTLQAQLLQDNQVYLDQDNYLKFLVTVPSTTKLGYHKLYLNIHNDSVISKKEFNVNVIDCSNVATSDFLVSGNSASNYVVYKNKELNVPFNIKNVSKIKKTIFISTEGGNKLSLNLTNRQLDLLPGESKDVNLTVFADNTVDANTYAVKISFFDEKLVKSKQLYFQLQPNYNLHARMNQTGTALNIGQNSIVYLYLENKGDLTERVKLSTITSNDINLTTDSEVVSVYAHKTKIVKYIVSAGPNTVVKTSTVTFLIDSLDSDFKKKLSLNVIAFRPITPTRKLNIKFLSYPDIVSLDVNGSKNISFDIYNNDMNDSTILKMLILDLPNGLSYSLPSNILLKARSSTVVNGKVIAGDIEPQDINTTVVIYGSNGSVIVRPIEIKVEGIQSTFQKPKKLAATGFFNFSRSLFLGIILLCLLLILLFVLNVIKRKHRQPHGNNYSEPVNKITTENITVKAEKIN